MDNTVKIILDNYVNACYPGQTLSGRVECIFDKEKTVRAVRIRFRGRAKTRWTKKHGKSSTTYSSEEMYFDEEYNLVTGGEDFKLHAGKHTYPFSYILPQTLPSSFEGSFGNVRYTIKATVDRPWKFDYEQKLCIMVFSPLDLNQLPGLQEPIAVSVDKQVTSGCCRTDPLTFNISLPISGFVPGQQMSVHVSVQNMSNITAENVVFKIIMEVEFIAHHPSTRTKYEEVEVIKFLEGAIGAHAEKSWIANLTVPIDNFPNLLPCSLINIRYHLEAKVVLPFPHTDLGTDIPITIGAIPLSVNMSLPGPPPQMSLNPPRYSATAPTVEGTPLI